MHRIVCFVATAVLVGLVPSLPATGAETLPSVVIQAGAVHPTNPQAPYEYTAYYPRGADGTSTVEVHRNDVVEWRFPGFHSVTFLPDDDGVDDDAHHPVWVRGDEVPGTMAVNEPWWTSSGCGRPGQEVCVIDGDDTFVSSGAPLFDKRPFQARFDLPAGTAVRYHCTVHPDMHGRIAVVPDTTALPSQADVDAQISREVAEDSAEADAMSVTATFDAGSRTWTVLAGAQTASGRVQFLSYLGQNPDGEQGPLRIERGDAIEFVVTGQDPHTVTFPSEIIGATGVGPAPGPPYGTGGLRGTPRCELDDPATGSPGVPFHPAAVAGCPVGAVEITLSPWMTDPHVVDGGRLATPATYADSGLMVAADNAPFIRTRPTTPATDWPSVFTVSFPNAGTFSYGCNLHLGFMTASVQVS